MKLQGRKKFLKHFSGQFAGRAAFLPRGTGMVFLLVIALLLTGCGKEQTILSFSFQTAEPYCSKEEKILCFPESYDNMTLDARLSIDTGSVFIQVSNAEGDAVWSNTYEKSGSFQIELKGIAADEEYLLTVSADQTKRMELQVISPVKLVKEKEKPERK